jgi:hypothetical protein
VTIASLLRHKPLLLFTLMFLALGTPSAAAAPAMIFRFPYQPNQSNQCTGEYVAFEGQALLELHISTNPDGSFHVSEHFNTQGVSGTGVPSGDRYSYSETDSSQQEYDVDATITESHTVHHLELIHAGETLPNDDRHEHVNIATTFSNGVPTTRIDNVTFECR